MGETMVQIRVNGKDHNREFQNMSQALAFAANNGECINAETLEFAYKKLVAKGGAGVKGGAAGKSGSGASGGSNQHDSFDASGKSDSGAGGSDAGDSQA
jgi:hypothetical protein